MKITKEAAWKISDSLTAKKQEALDAINEKIKTFGNEIARATIPKPILQAFTEQGAGWFNTVEQLQMHGHGLNRETIRIDPIPHPDSAWTAIVEVKANQANKMIRLLRVRSTFEKQIKELKAEIVSALLSLGTHARITEKFPEAAPFLPNKEKAEVMVNIADIRKKL